MSSPPGTASGRKGHVVLDLVSRQWKAVKIEKLLGLDATTGLIRMLEVGTGSGGIANYFGSHASGRFEVDAVDITDTRLLKHDFRFSLVSDTELPFPNDTFDVVISNHVIEHVGDLAQQHLHMCELSRVLKPNGRGYLAVPNRWMLVEPHYNLAFLSWLPRSMRDGYLKFWRGVDTYDCEPLELGELEACFTMCGLSFRNRGTEALRHTLEIERASSRFWTAVATVPDRCIEPFRRLMPTLIYTFERGNTREP